MESKTEMRVGDRVVVVKNPYSKNVPNNYESTISRKKEDVSLITGKNETHYHLAGPYEQLYFREDELALVP